MAYLLKRPLWTKEDEKGQRKQIGYEYKFFSAQYNSRNEVLTDVEKKIKEQTTVFWRPDTEWKFVRYLHCEISVFRLESTIGYAVSLPLHFYEDSNKKNVIKFENLKDNLCFWRCLTAHMNTDKTAYRRLETPTKELYSNFYGKKYEENYEGVKYLEYRKFADADIDESEYEKAIDEIQDRTPFQNEH